MNRRVLLLGFVAGIAFLAGCNDPLTPEDLAGTYSLTRLDARALPQLLSATISCDESVESEELILESTGAYSLLLRGTLDCTRDGGAIQTIRRDFPGTFSMSGRLLPVVPP